MSRSPESIERRRAHDRLRNQSESRKKAFNELPKRWMAKNPEWRKAQWAVGNAVRDGKLQKLPCFICGSERVEAHHADYSVPLSVVWLCTIHHRQAHAIMRRIHV